MTFVRRRCLSRGLAGGESTESLDSIFPGHFRIGYGARSIHLLLLYTGQRFDDSTTDGTRGVGDGHRKRREWQAYPPSFLQDVLLLRPF